MKDVLKLTGITGQRIYVRDLFSLQAIAEATEGDMKFTTIHLPGVMFRVKEPAEDIAALLGWEPKKIEPPKASGE